MRVIKNYLYNATYQLFKIIIPFITIPYLSRILGPKGIGINSYTNSIIQYFILLGDLGITVYGDRKIAYVRNDKYKLTQTFFEILIMQIFTLTLSYLLFFIFLMFTNQYRRFYLAQSILIIAYALDISWFFMGVENFRITVLRNFVVKLFFLICIFIFVKSYSDLLIYIILYGMSYVIGNVTLFINLHRYINMPDLKDLNVFRHFLPALFLFIPNVFMQIYLVLNKTMLGVLDSVNSSGFFDQSDKVVKMALAIVTATGTVMLPHVAHAFASGKFKATKYYLYDSFALVSALSSAIAFGLASVSYSFVPLFFGHKFIIIAPVMMIESIVIILIAWSNAIGIQYLLPTKQTKKFTISIIFGALINIVVNIPLILFLGVMGAVVTTVISELTVTLYQLFTIRNQVKFSELFQDVYKYLFSGFLMFCFIFPMNIFLQKTWIMLMIEIFIGVIIYMLSIFITKANIFRIIKKMTNNIKY